MKNILLFILGLSLLFSCEILNNSAPTINKDITSQYLLSGTLDVYLSNNQVFRYVGKPGIVTIPIGNANLSKYENCFILHISTGSTKATTVSSATIKLDGLNVLSSSAFSKNIGHQYTFEICNLTPTSVLAVEIAGQPSSYLNIWIEGKLKEEDLTVSDVEGNVYKTVKIGAQTWMAENLKTSKYRNLDVIGTTTPPSLDISSGSVSKYQWAYDGNESYVSTYGRLYTWYAATDSRNVCPSGWHVPTDAEWTILTDYLENNGYGYEGSGNDIAKSMAATSGWNTDGTSGDGSVGFNQAINNTCDFTGLPGGVRGPAGWFVSMYNYGYWWSSTVYPQDQLRFYRAMAYNGSTFDKSISDASYGFSIRCLKDN
jgi:uncharacterized protein (TIGR02145 family)